MPRLFALALTLAIAGAALPLAAAPVWPGTENSAPALGGHDPVAYFSGGAKMGKDSITATHDGVTFRFVSAANRDAFVAAPTKYLPQFGGYCAWAASQGRLSAPDPTLATVVEGKLYLNCSKGAEKNWLADVPGNIAKGAAFWATQQ